MACHGWRSAAGRWRSDRAHPEPPWLPCSAIVVSTFIGPGWLPEQLGSLHKAGSRKMIQTSTISAGIDVCKAKLDIAVHGLTGCWQVSNKASGWRQLAADLGKANVTRVGIEATGGYERGVVQYLRGKGFTVFLLQTAQVRALARAQLRGATQE